jgi:hypothetical protein
VQHYSLLHAVDYLLYKICIVTLQFQLLKRDICIFTKFLMRATEVGLEVLPSFVGFKSAIPFCYVVLETPGLVEYGIRFCNHFT